MSEGWTDCDACPGYAGDTDRSFNTLTLEQAVKCHGCHFCDG